MIAHGECIKYEITLQQHAVLDNNNRIPAYDLKLLQRKVYFALTHNV